MEKIDIIEESWNDDLAVDVLVEGLWSAGYLGGLVENMEISNFPWNSCDNSLMGEESFELLCEYLRLPHTDKFCLYRKKGFEDVVGSLLMVRATLGSDEKLGVNYGGYVLVVGLYVTAIGCEEGLEVNSHV